MIPRTLPAGTTLRSLVLELLPEDHAANVSKDAGTAKVCLQLRGGPCFTLLAEGDRLTATETSRVEPASLLVAVDETTAQLFLDDWMGAQKLAPTFEPRGLAAVTDARFLRRVAAVKGVISLTLDDFEGQRATVLVASGPDASLYDDVDASLTIKLPAFLSLLAGKLGPDEAILDGHVMLSGKKLVAMQFALALAPYFPVRE
jgi:putative sterol carrier protein